MSEWKPWNGGICPVDVETEVFYLIRNSAVKALGPAKAGLLRWDHGRTPDSPNRSNDIICYRSITPGEIA